MRLGGGEDAARELGRVGPADRDGRGAGVEPAREQDVVDDPGEPLGLAGDDREHPRCWSSLERDVVALQRHRGAVDRGERRPQLVRDGRDEVALQLLDGALLGQVAERVDGALRELGGGEREPELALAAVDRERLRPLAAGPSGQPASTASAARADDLASRQAR